MLVASNEVLASINVDRAAECMKRSDFTNALIYLDVALEQNPDDQLAHWNRAMSLLSLGRYQAGFAEFENRWGFCDWRWSNKIKPKLSIWDDVTDKRILLIHDAGRGDGIMMLRYVPLLVDIGVEPTILVVPELKRLAEQFGAPVITEFPDLGMFDLACPMFSLPFVLGDTAETIPSAPYLQATPRSSGRRVGICWSGITQTSLTLERFLDHLRIDGEEIQSLQPGPVGQGVQPLPEGDFQDLAEIIMGLDHIVSVDTAVPNLAGALGHPSTHVLLRTVMDFRWWRAAAWYPTVKCYRQWTPDSWVIPFEQVRNAIAVSA